jgi:hypothetical protein
MKKLLQVFMIVWISFSMSACAIDPASTAPAAENIVQFAIVGKAIGAAEVAQGLDAVYRGNPQTFAMTNGTVTMFGWPMKFGEVYTWGTAYWSNATQGWVGFKTGSEDMAQLYTQLTKQGYTVVTDLRHLPAELYAMISAAAPQALQSIQFLLNAPILVVPVVTGEDGSPIFSPPDPVRIDT